MTITFGRRQLIVALMGTPVITQRRDIPSAVNASDAELAQINARLASADTRRQRESIWLLYGGPR
ncbi:MAG TPA: hypothetical protein VFL82_16920 [Thermomicrobiales bacterium]|nr:hypothetical protein [Thermomicrobiales bacterium]